MSGPVAVLGGTAGLGRALALRLAKAGCRVLIGSRSRERAENVAVEVSQKVVSNDVSGMLNEEAAAASRFVFFTVPYPGMYELARRIKGVLKPDSIVVSCVVPLESDLGGAFDYVEPPDGSAAEALSRILDGDRVVSALTYVSAHALEELERGLDCDIVVCGKKEYAQEVMSLLSGIEGARLLYAGDLKYSRVTERLTILLIALNRRYGSRKAGVRFTNI